MVPTGVLGCWGGYEQVLSTVMAFYFPELLLGHGLLACGPSV
jgi:hypothetical protein